MDYSDFQAVYACQSLGYKSKTPFMPNSTVSLSASPFDVSEECLNTNEESTLPSSLISSFTAECYYRVTPIGPKLPC